MIRVLSCRPADEPRRRAPTTRNAASTAVLGPKTRRIPEAYGSGSDGSSSASAPRRRRCADGRRRTGGADRRRRTAVRRPRLARRGGSAHRRARRAGERGRRRLRAAACRRLLRRRATIAPATWAIASCPRPAAASSCSAPCWARARTRRACARAHSSVCSTSARAAFVSSVAWWRDCSSSRLPSRLGLLELARRVGVRLREQLAGLVPRGVQHLGALALALLPVALDLGLALLQLVLAAADLLLGARRAGRRTRSARRARSCRRTRRRRESGAARPCGRRGPVGSTAAGAAPAAWSTRSCACSWAAWRRNASKASRTRVRVEAVPGRGDVLELRQRRSATAPPALTRTFSGHLRSALLSDA